MKYCSKCGKELMDEAVVCPNCGCVQTGNSLGAMTQFNKLGIDTYALIFAVLVPIVGLIFSIVGLCKYTEWKDRNTCILAVDLSIIAWAVWYILFWW